MKRNSKIVWLLIVLSVLVLAFASCKKPDDPGNGNTPGVVDDDVIYSPQVNTTLVLGVGIKESDVNAIKTAYYRLTDKDIPIVPAADAQAAHEIIVGMTDRELSKKAYRTLELLPKEEDDVGYVIYSDGKSVAIAFNTDSYGVDVAFLEAIENFVENYVKDESLKLEDGPVFYETFDPIEKQNKRDKEAEEKLWNFTQTQVSSMLGGDQASVSAIIDNLKGLKDFYNTDNKIANWIANLYDPEAGAFYYSNSARNSIGYLPDIISTYRALGLISAMFDEGDTALAAFLGEEIVNKIVSFTKNMQDENGYFYHPQWARKLIESKPLRKEADANAALDILALFGASPTYDIFGVKGEGIPAPASSLVTPFGESSVSAVSKVVAVSDIYIPSHLNSAEAFETYLGGLGILENTSTACDDIKSEISQYKAIDKVLAENGADYRLCDVLLKFLADRQDIDTGLWSGGVISYIKIGELVNIVEIYNALGKVIPNYRTIFNLIMNVASVFSEEYEQIETLAKPWSALAAVVENVVLNADESEKEAVNTAIADIYSKFGVALDKTKEQLARFIRKDGSFSSTSAGSASEYLGVSVALSKSDEGDVNATYIAVNEIYISIFKSINIAYVPMFNTSDVMTFTKTFYNLGEIIKVEAPDNFKIEDWEGFNTGLIYDLYLEKILGSVDTNFEIKEDVVKDAPSQVLKWNAASGSISNFLMFKKGTNKKIGTNGTFFETDLKLEAVNNDTVGVRFDFRSSPDGNLTIYTFMLLVDGPGSSLRIGNELVDGIGNDFSKTLDVKEGEWFKLRLECTDADYDYDYDGKNDVVYRVYINGTMVAEGHTPRYPGSVCSGLDLDNMRVAVPSGRSLSMSFDNTYLGQCRMEYEEPVPADTDTITYEPGVITNKTQPKFGLATSVAEISQMTVFGEVTKVLNFYTSSGSLDTLTVVPTLTLDTANAVSFETDIMIEPETDVSTLYIEPKTASGTIAFRLTLKATKNGDVTVSGADIPETVIGKSGEWLHIKVTYMNPRIDYTGDGLDDVLYKVYIGNAEEPVATGYALYNAGSYCAVSTLTKFVITSPKESVARFYLDNTRFWQVELVADDAPEFPNSGNSSLGGPDGDRSDNDGWTE